MIALQGQRTKKLKIDRLLTNQEGFLTVILDRNNFYVVINNMAL